MSAAITRRSLQPQQDLDNYISGLKQDPAAHVARVKRELSELERNQNDLSPISQLPVDVMIVIFSMNTTALAIDEQCTTLPDVVQLGHVCHTWREITLNTPSLWTVMQIRQLTNPDLLRFQLEKSKQSLLTVNYHCAKKDPPRLDLIAQIISGCAQRIRSLKVDGPDCAVQFILKTSRGMLKQLEALEVQNLPSHNSHHLRNHGLLPEEILPLSNPSLRTLHFIDYSIPWKSLILTSPNLTSLAMGSCHYDGGRFTPQFISQLLSFLQHSPQLLSLMLMFPLTNNSGTAFEANLTQVDLPNLQVLLIKSVDPLPINLILPQLILSSDALSLLEVIAAQVSAAGNHAAVSGMLSHLGRTYTRVRLPRLEQVLLSRGDSPHYRGVSMKGWSVPSLSSGPYPDGGPVYKTEPLVSFTAYLREHGASSFPLTNPWHSNLDWWFSNIQALIVHDIVPTAEFWAMLSTRLTIQFLSVTLAPSGGDYRTAFYDALCGHAASRYTACKTPFPALRILQLCGNNIHSDVSTVGAYVRTFDALQSRRSTFTGEVPDKHPLDLDEVIFVNCPSMVAKKSLEGMLDVADKVAWHARAKDSLSSTPQHCQVERSELNCINEPPQTT